jgi:hypothetical protein
MVADNDLSRASLYREYLMNSGHTVVVPHTGLDCLKIYRNISRRAHIKKHPLSIPPAFHVVIIGDNMPDQKAVEIAKEILSVNPRQRLILTSNQIVNTLYDILRELKVSIELLQYHVSSTTLVNRVKDRRFHAQLEKIDSKVKARA